LENKKSYKLSCLAAVFFLVHIFIADNSQAATITAASCSHADINAALVSASAGDTILVPAGVCVWGNYDRLNIKKSISLIGAGTAEPNLTKIVHNFLDDDSSSTPVTFNINLTSDVPVRISGFYFDKVSNVSGSSYPYYYLEAIHINPK
jgi:hypothetical protein